MPCKLAGKIEFLPDGMRFILYGNRIKGFKGVVTLWDRSTWERIAKHTFDEGTMMVSAAVTPCGDRVIVGCDDGDVRVLSCMDGTLLHLHTFAIAKSGNETLHSLATTPIGDTLVIVGQNERMQVWNMSTYDMISTMESSIDSEIGSRRRQPHVCVTADGSRAVTAYVSFRGGTADRGGRAHVWSLASNTLAGTIDEYHDLCCFAPSPTNPAWVVLGGKERAGHSSISVWDVIELSQVHVIPTVQVPHCVCFSPDGAFVLDLERTYTVQASSDASQHASVVGMWDTSTWTKVQYMYHHDPSPLPYSTGYHQPGMSLAVSPNNEVIVAVIAGGAREGNCDLIAWRGPGNHVVPK